MSKLAALAAKRRQQEASKSSSTASDQIGDANDYAETLNKLRIGQTNRTSSRPDGIPTSSKEQGSVTTNDGLTKDQAEDMEKPLEDQDQLPTQTNQDIRGSPSPLASLLTDPARRNHPNDMVPLPHADPIVKTFDFNEPSPDDIVTRAQGSKGPRQA